MRRYSGLGACLAAITILLASSAGQDTSQPFQMVDVTARSGIRFRHHTGGSGQGYIVEGVTGGVATFDYDGDGLIDIFFLNGGGLKGSTANPPPRAALYRNNGDWNFTDVTDEAGVGHPGFGLGVVAADYDNDGDIDLYLNNFGPNVLYRNNGDRTFTDVTAHAGVGNGDKVGAGASFLDMDGDGDLDLYVANYVDFTYANHVPIIVRGHAYKAGPQYYNSVPDTLYRNNDDGTFTDVSEESGIAAVAGPGMATLCFDYDDDGDADVFVCNDGKANFLFQNDGRGKFKEVALVGGVAFDFFGKANSNMGVDCADYDNDGRLDLFTTDYQSELPVLYRNLGKGMFEDATSSARITNELYAHVHWGTGFVDFDLDGHRDLFIACGHFDRIEQVDDRTSLKVPNYLLRNLGNGKFADVSKQAGTGLAVVESSRGAAFDDFDNDGDVDAIVLNSDAAPTLMRNDLERKNHWLELKLVGTKSNKDAVGARVFVHVGPKVHVSEVIAGRSYQGHCGVRQYFGLRDAAKIDEVRIRWPGGAIESFGPLLIDRLHTLTEGEGTQAASGEATSNKLQRAK
jgi:hypothetical protein